MPQLTPVVLKDSLDADHTFIPTEVAGGVAVLVESNGIPLGDRRLTLSKSQTANGRRKVTVKLSVPVVQDQVLNGVSRPTVVRTAYADLTFTYDSSSSKKERTDLAYHIGVLMSRPLFEGVNGDLQGLY